MLPLRIDSDGIPIFSAVDIDDYGDPTDWGYPRFYVVEEPRYQYTFEQETMIREKHQYCRVTRFRLLLACLLNQNDFSSKKGKKCLKKMRKVDLDLVPTGESLWSHCCKEMRRNGFGKYYNWIPVILGDCNILDCSPNVWGLMGAVMVDFMKMHLIFDSVAKEVKRRYFLPLRYVALKLALKYGYDNPLQIPLAKTKMRLKQLDKDFDFIWEKISLLDNKKRS